MTIAAVIGSVEGLIMALEWAVVGYFLLVNGFALVLITAAGLEMRRHLQKVWHESRRRLLGSEAAPRISVLAPAHDEEATVAESVRALLTLQYPNLEVVVVNDGSSDRTLAVLEREFALRPIHPIYRRRIEHQAVRGLYRSATTPKLLVVDKKNGGKADALNAGLNVASGGLVCAIDADTLIESDALLRMARPFLLGRDIAAAGGTIRVGNGSLVRGGRVVERRVSRRFLAGVQSAEYVRAFLFGRLGWNRLGGNLIISGAFGLFRREAVINAGGYLHDTVGEDMELVARLRRVGIERGEPDRVEFVPDPVAWTEVPESLRGLGRQRERWHRGLADCVWRYRDVMLRPRYGALGMVALPYFVVFELLAPVIEAAALLGLALAVPLGAVDPSFALLFFAVAYGFGIILSCLALLLDELGFSRSTRIGDRLKLLGWALIEPLGYRQLTVVWRLRGLWRFLRGRRDWGSMSRQGFAVPPAAPAVSGPQ